MIHSLLLALSLAVPAEVPPVRPVAAVDLERYLGKWYEIARYPNRFQKSCAASVTAEYSRKEDGRLRVLNACRRADNSLNEADGVARVVGGSNNARLKVRFAPAWLGVLPFVWGDYWVIGLQPEYRWAVVGTPDRKYLWVLSRTATMTEEDWAAAMEAVSANGFDPTGLQRTRQGQ